MRIQTWARVILVAASVVALAATTGCGSGESSSFDGAQLASPIALPPGTFTDTAGAEYDLKAKAQGHLTLVYFGYTNCPDVCPTTMADIGTALRSLPAATQKDVHVVFITSDPVRDTPAVLKRWLGNFDQNVPNPFVGLNTDVSTVVAYAAKVGVPIEAPTTNADGTVEVTHGSQVLAFEPDGEANLVWLGGTTPKQYAHDIALLAKSGNASAE